MKRTLLRPLLACLALVATLSFVVVEADARSRGGMGSRGSRTYSAPPPTATAPNQARPVERSMTQPGQPGQPGASTVARGQTPAAQPGGFLNRPGLLGGLAAGFLGAGLFGLLAGHGFLGGLAGLASFFGLLLQVGIIALVAMLIWRWWQGRSQQPAYAGGRALNQAANEPRPRPMLGGLGGGLGGVGGLGGSTAAGAGTPVEAKPEDFDTFERLLGEIQTAYGREDLNALRERVTPEMLSYYSDELAHNQSNGDRNEISDVKLLQGDLAEAWREGNDEYATVAMRYSLNDRIVARDDGRLVEQLPSEATELWTFRRSAGGGKWVLSAIQQTED
jgi:predicted lipid-binding transport protein (Tim44 family)